jgi:transglutaminase-like putative cysteine protease
MRKRIAILIISCISVLMIPSAILAASEKAEWLDTGKLDQGLIGIQYEAPKGAVTKLMVKKSKGETYTYDLIPAEKIEYFPLQLGNGDYTVTIAQLVAGTKYKAVSSKTVKLALKDENTVYKGSIQNVNWSESKIVSELAIKLTKNAKTDEEKIEALYKYVTGTVKYDNDKASMATAGYIPNIESTYTTSSGICYDYAALFAGMARSLGIPTKLAMGTTKHVEGYHAWNEAYVDGEWIVIDTTIDASAVKKTEMSKKAADYTVSKLY